MSASLGHRRGGLARIIQKEGEPTQRCIIKLVIARDDWGLVTVGPSEGIFITGFCSFPQGVEEKPFPIGSHSGQRLP